MKKNDNILTICLTLVTCFLIKYGVEFLEHLLGFYTVMKGAVILE